MPEASCFQRCREPFPDPSLRSLNFCLMLVPQAVFPHHLSVCLAPLPAETSAWAPTILSNTLERISFPSCAFSHPCEVGKDAKGRALEPRFGDREARAQVLFDLPRVTQQVSDAVGTRTRISQLRDVCLRCRSLVRPRRVNPSACSPQRTSLLKTSLLEDGCTRRASVASRGM